MAKQRTGRTIEWTIYLDNKKYIIKIVLSAFGGRHKIYLNDEPVPFTGNALMSYMVGFDQRLPIEGHEVYVFGRGSKTELAVNGKVRGDKKTKFTPMPSTPKWIWIFNILFIFLIPLGGLSILSFVFAFCGIWICSIYAHKPRSERERLTGVIMLFIAIVALFFIAGRLTNTLNLWFLSTEG